MPGTEPAGYSGTPLPKKLGIGSGTPFATLDAPVGFADALGSLPDGATWATNLGGTPRLVVAFHTSRAALVEAWPTLTESVGKLGSIWVSWPKKSSGLPTDITENTLREDLLPSGWVDVKVCAIDQTWSGLKFVLRKELR